MFWEHDWTADGPVSRKDRANWQIKQKNYITGYVDTLYNRASQASGNMTPASANLRVYAHNSLSWTRSDSADFAYTGKLPVKLIDVSTNNEAIGY